MDRDDHFKIPGGLTRISLLIALAIITHSLTGCKDHDKNLQNGLEFLSENENSFDNLLAGLSTFPDSCGRIQITETPKVKNHIAIVAESECVTPKIFQSPSGQDAVETLMRIMELGPIIIEERFIEFSLVGAAETSCDLLVCGPRQESTDILGDLQRHYKESVIIQHIPKTHWYLISH